MSDLAWWQAIEGSQADAMPAAYWIALYRDLERTLAAITLENPDAGRRLSEVRRRLHHWETTAQRLTEPPGRSPSRAEPLAG